MGTPSPDRRLPPTNHFVFAVFPYRSREDGMGAPSPDRRALTGLVSFLKIFIGSIAPWGIASSRARALPPASRCVPRCFTPFCKLTTLTA